MDRRRKLFIALQVTAVAVFLGFLGYALRDSWGEAGPRLRDADVAQLALAFGLLAVYYLLFVLGWLWILRALHINVSYRVALQAEMVSMLAKYVPGGVWTPAARVVALRRHGITATPTVLGSIALEAGLSAIAGVLVLVVSLPTVDDSDAPLWPLLAFAVVLSVLLHPRIFRPLARRAAEAVRRLGAAAAPAQDAAGPDRVLRGHVGLRRAHDPVPDPGGRRRRRLRAPSPTSAGSGPSARSSPF